MSIYYLRKIHTLCKAIGWGVVCYVVAMYSCNFGGIVRRANSYVLSWGGINHIVYNCVMKGSGLLSRRLVHWQSSCVYY